MRAQCVQIYDGKCVHYIDWLTEVRPSFSPPRHDLRPADADPGATEVYSKRLDTLNSRFESLFEQLTQRLKTAIEVNGADGLVSTLAILIKLIFDVVFTRNSCQKLF